MQFGERIRTTTPTFDPPLNFQTFAAGTARGLRPHLGRIEKMGIHSLSRNTVKQILRGRCRTTTKNENGERVRSRRCPLTGVLPGVRNFSISSPRLSQLDSCFIERGTFAVKRLRRTPQISLYPWGSGFPEKPEPKPVAKQRPDGMKLARHYQALLDSGKFENRAALARHLGVSRARVTQVLRRLE